MSIPSSAAVDAYFIIIIIVIIYLFIFGGCAGIDVSQAGWDGCYLQGHIMAALKLPDYGTSQPLRYQGPPVIIIIFIISISVIIIIIIIIINFIIGSRIPGLLSCSKLDREKLTHGVHDSA